MWNLITNHPTAFSTDFVMKLEKESITQGSGSNRDCNEIDQKEAK